MKSKRKKLVETLDRLVSIYIRRRDGECVVCGATQRLTNGHLFSRNSYSTRWDISENGNCHTQCSSCNFSHELDSYPFTKWYIDRFGLDTYDNLHKRYKTVAKFKDADLEIMIENTKKLISGLTDK